MQRIWPSPDHPGASLHGAVSTRRIEAAAAASLPPHTLMQRAGLAVARLAMAMAPHARCVWLACGPGNNGGDGLEAALHLQAWGKQPVVTWLGDETTAPADALASLRRARGAGVSFAEEPPALFDLAIDALLGIGATRAPADRMAQWLDLMEASGEPVLMVDVPSRLNADTGAPLAAAKFDVATNLIAGNVVLKQTGSRFCLNLLTVKPGLFTASGRDYADEIWFDDLGLGKHDASLDAGDAQLVGAGMARSADRPHASHKGDWGDVAVVGGAPGMVGAAFLAARAALHAGAGRVFVCPLDEQKIPLDPTQPELMLRGLESLDLKHMTVVCGCGGGDAVHAALPRVLSTAQRLVLDADALNAVARDSALQRLLRARAARGLPTVLTPHPLEAARLAGMSTTEVQGNRLACARQLVQRFTCVVVLKGSGTVIAAPGAVPWVNPTGNARLATAGTGDVLAGMLGAQLACEPDPVQAALRAVYQHGQVADEWQSPPSLTAGGLAQAIQRG